MGAVLGAGGMVTDSGIGKQQPDLIGQRMAYLGDAQLRLGLQACTLFLVVVQ